MKKKFTIEFDEEPTFLYVSHGHNQEKIYIHGNPVKHWTQLKLHSSVDEFTEYDISYIDAKDDKA